MAGRSLRSGAGRDIGPANVPVWPSATLAERGPGAGEVAWPPVLPWGGPGARVSACGLVDSQALAGKAAMGASATCVAVGPCDDDFAAGFVVVIRLEGPPAAWAMVLAFAAGWPDSLLPRLPSGRHNVMAVSAGPPDTAAAGWRASRCLSCWP